MSLLEIIFLAIVLSCDAFLVSFSYGVSNLKNYKKAVLSIAIGVSFFQFLMPLIGATVTNLFFELIKNYANYIAAVIFILLGVKLFVDACASTDEEDKPACQVDVTLKTVLMISVATSIDALAAGASLFLLKVNVLLAASVIGIITFVDSLIGFYLAKKLKKLAPKFWGKLGGVLLVIIGIKTIFG